MILQIPHGNVHPLAHPEAAFMRRAQFLKHQLWVTRYHPEHRYPGGDFPNQNPRVGDGLPAWAAQDNSLRDASLVMWCVVKTSAGNTKGPPLQKFLPHEPGHPALLEDPARNSVAGTA